MAKSKHTYDSDTNTIHRPISTSGKGQNGNIIESDDAHEMILDGYPCDIEKVVGTLVPNVEIFWKYWYDEYVVQLQKEIRNNPTADYQMFMVGVKRATPSGRVPSDLGWTEEQLASLRSAGIGFNPPSDNTDS